MGRWLAVILTLMLLIPAVSAGCSSTSGTDIDRPGTDNTPKFTDEAHGDGAAPNYGVVFPQDRVSRMDIVIEPADWQAVIDDMTACQGEFGSDKRTTGGRSAKDNPQGESQSQQNQSSAGNGSTATMWVQCAVVFNDTIWEHVGIRLKGFSSLVIPWEDGVWKLPFRLDFDQFEDDYPETEDQRFYGFKKLSLSNGYADDSLIREKVIADIFREAGVPAAATAFYALYIDYGDGPVYFGLYTMIEIPDDPMLDTQFGDDSGNLYKPIGSGATFCRGNFSQSSFPKHTNEDVADWRDIIALFNALHANTRTTYPAAWRGGLEAVFDVEGFLRWLAVNTVIQNWDTYGNEAKNYYLYNNPGDGLLHWIAWDHNMALTSTTISGLRSLSLSLSEVSDEWPLISYLIGDERYYEMYLSLMNDFIGGVFTIDHVKALCQESHDLIALYVAGDSGEQEGYTFLKSDQAFYDALDDLFEQVEARNAAALAFLSEHGFNAIE